MKRSWLSSIRPALALLLTALMLVTGTAVAMESSAMAASGARMGNALSHCHHHSADTSSHTNTHSSMSMNHMGMDQQTDSHCPDDNACQCITLCQVSAITLTRFVSGNDSPAQHYLPGPVIAVSPGIHQLPLRPPTLTV
ncbi:hypothetical protein MWU49_08325 [Alcanivorax sp. S6407]|uniref:hypothetical protein n=1 Tax=Alcanivorax sp. S6407 TaxID=2926424 RepID=UPI001FF250C6|nr:hypothetical protein [Alcanivorax sp. S6407]MCK0153704.1 hypothetical protein [Alcanivorax sp. S6407]